jgi:sporulation protein YlmC with PRC-barrel domain
MAHEGKASLVRLSDSGQVLADPAEDIRDRKVRDRDGNDIGKVEDLLIDGERHKVRFLLVEQGGILGIGATPLFVPVDAVARVDDDTVYVNESGERVSDAPGYDPSLLDGPDFESLYGHYGYAPFWAPGYVYPGYPYYR